MAKPEEITGGMGYLKETKSSTLIHFLKNGGSNPELFPNKRILITGGNGFIGSVLREILCRTLGAVVYTLDVQANSHSKDVAHAGRVMYGDIANRVVVRHALAVSRPDIIFHLAAWAPVEWSEIYPLEAFRTNALGTVVLLDAIKELRTNPAIVIASSDKVYGPSADTLTEKMPLAPVHPYDVSKAAADMMAQTYVRLLDFNLGIARMANTYGPGDNEFSRLIPYIIRCGLSDEPLVFRTSGKQERDYLFILDAISGYLSLASALYQETVNSGEAWNFSSLEVSDAVSIASNILDMMGKSPLMKTATFGEEGLETPKIRLESSKARTLLGWVQQYKLEIGLKVTIDAWMEENNEE